MVLFAAMNFRRWFIPVVAFLFFGLGCTKSEDRNTLQEARIKIGVRQAGNRLLLAKNDSKTLVLPVNRLDEDKYTLSFQNELSFFPNDLVLATKSAFRESGLSQRYIIEVIQCSNDEVAYSYEIHEDQEKTIIPCAGRLLPMSCYTINVQFLDVKDAEMSIFSLILLFVAIGVFVVAVLRFRESKKNNSTHDPDNSFTQIGSFKFYPDQNKLVKEAQDLPLSRKECELLLIFIQHPNQVVKRELLTKRVWEDKGVIVGRSLDTYISKLRKKLSDDASVKISNVHGVGYKLETI